MRRFLCTRTCVGIYPVALVLCLQVEPAKDFSEAIATHSSKQGPAKNRDKNTDSAEKPANLNKVFVANKILGEVSSCLLGMYRIFIPQFCS